MLFISIKIFDSMKLKIMAIVAGLGLVSCMNPMEDDMTLSDTISGKPLTKIVCFNDSYDQASLLVKFQTSPTPEFLEQMSAQTGARLEKLFPSSPGKAELEARFGLDRWYVVSGWQQGGVDAMASVFAQKAEISLVQYNHFSQKASDFEVGVEGTITKASVSDLPFNDPMLSDQWHYYNDGNLSITTSVKRGADINVKDVWAQLTCGDPSIVIAVVD